MTLITASRGQSKIKMALQGPSGSGKTYSSLLIAYGLVGDWSKIAVIDTENGSSNLYADLGQFKVYKLDNPHSPERYTEAISECISAGIECIIIDSISHGWEYLLDVHANMAGNSFANWGKITPRQQAFVNAILRADAHVVCTMRTKQDYVLQEKNGKHVPEKVGLKAVQRDGIDYDFTIVLDIDIKHNATASKDRTGLFMGSSAFSSFRPSTETGSMIKRWSMRAPDELKSRISKCSTIKDLKELYEAHKPVSREILGAFAARKRELLTIHQNGQTTAI